MKKQINELKTEFNERLQQSSNEQDLDQLQREFIGRNGKLRQFFASLSELPEEERSEAGRSLNEAKSEMEEQLAKARKQAGKSSQEGGDIPSDSFDPTLPGARRARGSRHPLTKIQNQVVDIFTRMGFRVAEGSYIEDEFYNFDALNIPPEHPARDLWDTFWLKSSKETSSKKQETNLLLRTHTSPVQVHFMEHNNPPFRVVMPGRCFRYENADATHNFEFYQLEGLMVDKPGRITAAHLKWVARNFFETFFNEEVEVRFLPDYFPFTEPSFEIGVRKVGQREWLELAGAGMVHPKVFESAGLVPENWQGFAFGLGIDRLAMLKYGVDDVRLFYSNDLRVLRGFR